MKMTKFLAVMIAAVMFGSVSLSAAEAAPAEEAPGTWSKIGRTALLYIPNLVADALDLVSFEFSVGPTAAVDVHATYYLDFGVENTDAYYVGSMCYILRVLGLHEASNQNGSFARIAS